MMPFWELTESQRACRLDRAIHLSQESSGYGIGVQKERTVHSVLKFYLEPDVDQHEIPIGYLSPSSPGSSGNSKRRFWGAASETGLFSRGISCDGHLSGSLAQMAVLERSGKR